MKGILLRLAVFQVLKIENCSDKQRFNNDYSNLTIKGLQN